VSGEPDKAQVDVEPIAPPPLIVPIAKPATGSPASGNAVAAATAEVANPIGMTDDQIARVLEGGDAPYYTGQLLAMVDRSGGLRAFMQRRCFISASPKCSAKRRTAGWSDTTPRSWASSAMQPPCSSARRRSQIGWQAGRR
jgi:hypothetical protein